ncbi:MAG: beta strand repeat-containing protein, partial [Planctomycetaceae bacterium]
PGDLTITPPTASPLLVVAGATTVNGNITITAPGVRIVDVVRTGAAGNSVIVTAGSGDITFAVPDKRGIVTNAGSIVLSAASGQVFTDPVQINPGVAGGPLTISAKSADLRTNVSSVTASTTAGPLSLSAVNALTLQSLDAAGQTVSLSATQGVTQSSGAIKAATLFVTNTSGPITLTSPTNAVGAVSIADGAGDVSFTNAGSFTVVAPGVATGTGAVGDGNVTLTSLSGSIAINATISAPKDRVTLNAGKGSISQLPGTSIDCTSLVWKASSAPGLSGTFTVVGPNLTSPGSLVLGPYATAVTVAGASTVDGDITITGADVLITDPVIAGGSGRSITVTATSGSIGIQSTGRLQTTAGKVSLAATSAITAANAATVTSVTAAELAVSAGGPVSLSASGLALGDVSVAGPLTLAAKGALTQKTAASVLKATTLDITGVGSPITLANAGNDAETLSIRNGGGSVTFRDVNHVVLDTIVAGPTILTVGAPSVSGVPALSQTPAGSVTATALSIVSTARGVQLPNAMNDVDSLAVSNPGRLVVFTDKDDLSLAGLTAGTATLTVGGNLTQTAAVTGSTLNITANAGNISLTRADNDVDWLSVSNPGRGLSFTDSDDLALGGLTAGPISLAVGGNLTQANPIVGTSLAVTASAGSISLTNTGNSVATAALSNGNRAVTYVNAGGLTLGGLTAGSASLFLGGNLTQTGAINADTLGITSTGTIDLRNAANNLNGLAINNGSRLVSYADSNNVAIASAGTLSVGTVTAAQLMTISTTNGGGVDVGPQANGLLQSNATLDLRGVQGTIGIRNGGRIVGNPVVLPAGKGIQVGGTITSPAALASAVNTINQLPPIAGSTYEILVGASMTLTQALSVDRPVTFSGTSQSVVLSGSPGVVNGLLLNAGASGSTVKDIAFSNFTGDAIRLTTATGITIRGIRATNSGNGLSINNASTNTVVQGNVFDRNVTGVRLTSATGALVGGTAAGQPNQITNSSQQGVFATGFCTGSKLVKNTMSGNATNFNVSTSRNLEIIT